MLSNTNLEFKCSCSVCHILLISFVSGLHHSVSSVFLSVFPQATQGPDAVSVPGHCEQQEVGAMCVRALVVSFPDHSLQYESRNCTASREGTAWEHEYHSSMLTGIMHVFFQ